MTKITFSPSVRMTSVKESKIILSFITSFMMTEKQPFKGNKDYYISLPKKTKIS